MYLEYFLVSGVILLAGLFLAVVVKKNKWTRKFSIGRDYYLVNPKEKALY